MIATVPRLDDSRSAPVTVARSALSSVAEDGSAACANALEAIERAISAITTDEAVALHQLQRAAFELHELRPNLTRLAFIADNAAASA